MGHVVPPFRYLISAVVGTSESWLGVNEKWNKRLTGGSVRRLHWCGLSAGTSWLGSCTPPWWCSGNVTPVTAHRENPGHAGETMFLGCPGNTSGFPPEQAGWSVWGERILSFPAQAVPPATRPRISGRRWIKHYLNFFVLNLWTDLN